MHRLATLLLLLASLVIGACDSEPPPEATETEAAAAAESELPPGAQPSLVEEMRADEAAPRHPSDGGGRAWLEPVDGGPPTAQARQRGRWTLVYEAGEHGIAVGGMVTLLVSPFWDWSPPQDADPGLPGYTVVSTEAEGVELATVILDRQGLFGIGIEGRPLAAGERIRIVYGAGEAGASADRFAERRSPFWIAVDGDGDGVRKTLADSPTLDVAAGPPARLVLTLPSTAQPGDALTLRIAVLDADGSRGVDFAGDVVFDGWPEGLQGPERVTLAPAEHGVTSVTVTAAADGIYQVVGRVPDRFSAESNPLLVHVGAQRILWADLHGHTNLSDGTGVPDDYFRYARDVAGLDVVALTDHDHWGILFLDEHPELWQEIRAAVRRYHDPGHFVTLLGFEWTSWIYGHRHVVWFADREDAEVVSSIDPATDDPRELWDRVRAPDVLTFAHHSAGGPIPTDWSIPPDPELEPVTEVVSVHGSSEAADSPLPIYRAFPGNYVRDALDRGYRLGFIGSGDSHDGHPGLAHLASPSGGLAAILADEATRPAVLEALRARRSYATNGPRIVLQASLAGHRMGSRVAADTLSGDSELQLRVVAPTPVAKVEVIRSGEIAAGFDAQGSRGFEFAVALQDLAPGEYLYVRVVQEDGGAAWSSPFFID